MRKSWRVIWKDDLFSDYQYDSDWRSHEEAFKRYEELKRNGLIVDLEWLG